MMPFDFTHRLKNINALSQKDEGCRLGARCTAVRQPLSSTFWTRCVRAAAVFAVVSSVNDVNVYATSNPLDLSTLFSSYYTDSGSSLTYTLTESNFPITSITDNSTGATPNLIINLTSSSETISGGISSPIASVTLNGSKTLTLSGANTYTGSTTIGSGATFIGNIPSSSAVTVNGTYDIKGVERALTNVSGTGTLTNSSSTNAGKILTLSSTADTTFSGIISDSFVVDPNNPNNTKGRLSLTKEGSGKLTLSGTNTYAGATTINYGTLLITGSMTGTGATSFNAGTLQIGNASTTGSLAGNVNTTNGTLVFNRSNAYTYAGNISGSGTVAQSGSGTLTLSGSYSGSGQLNLNSGTLNTSNTSTQGALGTCTVNFKGGMLQAGANILLQGSTKLSSNATLDVNGHTVTYKENPISGSSGLTISNSAGGSGIVIMSTETTNSINKSYLNTYTGVTSIGSSVTVVGCIATSIGVTVNGTYDLGGTALTLIDPSGSGSGTIQSSGYINSTTNPPSFVQSSSSNAALIVTSTNGSTFSGTLASSISGLTKNGSGTFVLAGTNNCSGGTTVSAGTLGLALSTAAGSGAITLSSGSTLQGNFNDSTPLTNLITLTGSATLLATQGFTTTGAISGSGNLIIDGGVAGGLNAATTGNAVTFAQSTANTYGGTTTLQGGATLSISAAAQLSTAALIMGSNTTLQVTGGGFTLPCGLVL
ncbi:MAG: autotransporter-associated beta strand repeat-containing protein [Pseudomonadota bacterium]